MLNDPKQSTNIRWLNSSVKDLNHWSINNDDLSIVVKSYVGPTKFFEWADKRRIMHQCASQVFSASSPLNLEVLLPLH